jgi:hypothetical protein
VTVLENLLQLKIVTVTIAGTDIRAICDADVIVAPKSAWTFSWIQKFPSPNTICVRSFCYNVTKVILLSLLFSIAKADQVWMAFAENPGRTIGTLTVTFQKNILSLFLQFPNKKFNSY